MKKNYEFLDQINFPSDLKKVPETKLQKVADELREEMIDAVSVTGGHLGASLGVVELSVAIHYIFNISLFAYLIVFLSPSKLIRVALPFFLSFPVFFPAAKRFPL